MLSRISHLFASLTHDISCSTLEINFIFPRNHVIFSIYLLHCTVRNTLGLQVHLSVPCLWNSCYQMLIAVIHSLNHRSNVFIFLPVFCLHLPCSTMLVSVPKCRCCHFLNNCISNATMFSPWLCAQMEMLPFS